MADITFEQVKVLVEQMPSTELERLRTWLNTRTDEHESWGEQLVRMVNEFDLDKADEMDIPDPEAWVREYRCTQTQKRNPGIF